MFDVAGTVSIHTEDGHETTLPLPIDCPQSKLNFLKDNQIDVLICGAISRRVQEYAESLGIRVNPFISGEVGEVLTAWKNGTLEDARYSMPGCRRCCRRQRHCK